MDETVLLNNLLKVDETSLETDDQKKEHIKKVQELWGKLSAENKTENLLLKVLNRVKAFKGTKGDILWNKEAILEIYENFPDDKKTGELYLNILKEIKFKAFEEKGYHYKADDKVIISILEMMPEDLKNRDGYLKILENGINGLWDVTRIYKKVIPEQILNQQFYEDFLDSLKDNSITEAQYFWIGIPKEMRTKEFFFKIAKKTDWISLKGILKENINFIETDNIVELYKIFLQKKEPYAIGQFSELISTELFTNKIYTDVMNEFLVNSDEFGIETTKRRGFDYAIMNFFATMPKECQTEEVAYKILDKINADEWHITEIFMSKIPEHLKSSKLYLEILKNRINLKEGVDKKRYCWFILDKIPKEYINANLVVEIADLNDVNFVCEYIDKLGGQFENENLYPTLMEKIAQMQGSTNYSKFFDKIPSEYITEENLLKMFEKKRNEAFGANKMFKAILEHKDDFSKEFYYELILNNKDYYAEIYTHMPAEFKNEDIFLNSIQKNIEDNTALSNLMKQCPMDRTNEETYLKIIQYIENNEKIVDNLKSKGIGAIIETIPASILGFAKADEIRKKVADKAIDSAKTTKNNDGDIVYSPNKVFEMVNSLLGGSSVLKYVIDEKYEHCKDILESANVYQYLDEIIQSEKENISNGIIKQSQIREYEKGLKINNEDESLKRNPFWTLNAVYYIIPEKLQYRYQESIMQFLQQNIYKLENQNNKKTIEFLKTLIQNNEDLFFTLDNRFLENDQYINTLGKEKYEVIVAFPEIQKTIANFDESYYQFFIDCINYSSELTKSSKEEAGEWIPIADALCKNLNNKQFKELNDEIIKVGFSDLSEEEKNTYLSIISKEENWFKVNNIDDLKNYENKKNEICRKILENPEDLKEVPQAIKRFDKNKIIIFARLQLEYGLDLAETTNLVEKYTKGLSDEQKQEGIGKLLLKMDEIINIDEDEIDDLRKFDIEKTKKTDYKILLNLEARCRESYLKEYSKSVYNPTNHDQEDERFSAEYDGKKIKVYEATDEFNMVIHALGAYSDKSKKENYKESWNMPKVGNHGLCTSFIGNNNLGTARTVNVIYGFCNFTPEQLLLSAPWDIISRDANTLFSTSGVKYNYKNGIRFCSPTAQIDNTRHTHNEMVWDRRQYVKGKHSTKMQPSYIIYMPDYLAGKNPEEIDQIMEKRDEVLKQYMENDPKWKETQRAAAQFGIPIVMVDRALCAKKESEKISNLMNTFEKTRDMKLISQIVNEFENNRAGNRDYHKEICEKYFSNEMLEGYLGRIESIIAELPTVKQRKKAYEFLKKAYDSEVEKRDAFKKTDKDEITEYWKNKSYSIYTKEQRTSQVEEIEIEQIIELLSTQENDVIKDVKKDFIDEVKDMKKRNLYNHLAAHSDRHIQNVMLFSYILGKQLGLSNKDIQLLVEAAKFHDSGREGDRDKRHQKSANGSDGHGKMGADIAGEKLKGGKYSNTDISIVQVAIDYHDRREIQKGKLDEKILEQLFKAYELPIENQESAKKICELLKEADALDRTRFAGKSQLDTSFLRTEEAKNLVELATFINEEYSRRNLEEICTLNEELRESIDKFKAKNGGSNLFTEWAIRHHKFTPKKSVKASMQELYEVASEVSNEEITNVLEEVKDIQETNNKHMENSRKGAEQK